MFVCVFKQASGSSNNSNDVLEPSYIGRVESAIWKNNNGEKKDDLLTRSIYQQQQEEVWATITMRR